MTLKKVFTRNQQEYLLITEITMSVIESLHPFVLFVVFIEATSLHYIYNTIYNNNNNNLKLTKEIVQNFRFTSSIRL